MKSQISRPGMLGREIAGKMDELTYLWVGENCLKNAYANADRIEQGQSIKALRASPLMEGDDALVIAAGPSMHRIETAKILHESGWKGTIICTDSAIAWCLNNGLIPDLVLTLDSSSERIVRWFGDPHLTEDVIRRDNYFERQEMDPTFTTHQLKNNRSLLDAVNQQGPNMRIALSSSSHHSVVNRVYEAGIQTYWWNPMFDDYDGDESVTRKINEQNRLPCVNAGGNVGTACWVFAHAVLKKKRVGLIGMDFGYYVDRPYAHTQYYPEILELVGPDRLDEVFVHIHNPYLEQEFYTDPAYYWYRDALLEMVQEADCRTYNCTGGGILFGPGIEWASLDDFLRKKV